MRNKFCEINKNNTESEDYYTCLFKEIRTPMLIINRATQEIIDANESACSFYQYSYEEMLNLKVDDIDIFSAEQIQNEIKFAINLNRIQLYSKHRLANGKIKDVEILCNVININGQNYDWCTIYDKSCNDIEEMYRYDSTCVDMSMSYTRIEKEIKNSTGALYNIINNTDAILFQLDKEGKYLFFEGKGLIKAGLQPGGLVGLSYLQLYKNYPRVINGFTRALSGEPVKIESDIYGRAYHIILTPDFDENGQCIGAIGLSIDITEMKVMENEIIKAKEIAEKASITKSEFIANMSHELRTPINVIFGAVQLFESYIKNDQDINVEKYKSHLNSMKQNCLRLLRIVNNLIDTTKIDSGFLLPNFQKHDIVEVIEKIVLSISDYAEQKNIGLKYNSQLESLVIICDIDMIERIMLNLISNAIKFTNNLISINTYIRNDSFVIEVKDNGTGIEEKNKNIIFERYKQASKLYTRENEGSGIGLSLTKSLIEMHGGTIYVESNYGKGSQFIVKLPIKSERTNRGDEVYITYTSNERFIEKMNVEFSDIYK